MISRETLEKIIEAGAQAPSGSNSQPWEFEVHDRSIDVHMLPQKDHPILNFKNRGTIFAVGTLVENIVIAADHYGFEASVTLFPNTSDHNVAAKIIILEKEDAVASTSTQLFDAIWKRSTNRKSYEKKRLDAERFEKLTNSLDPKEDLNIGIKFTDDEAAIKTLAEAASTNEVVMFENEPLHKLFFDEIVWTKKEEKERSSGLYVKTMELKPPQELALHLFKFWPVMSFFNSLGAAKGIAKGNADVYAQCSLYGAVLCDPTDEGFLNAGRAVERIWLTAVAAGLSFHLQTGINFLWQRSNAGEDGILSNEHKELVRKMYQDMSTIFAANEKFIPAIFRIGYGGEPTARSSKKIPQIKFY
jgi:hypothetical protein